MLASTDLLSLVTIWRLPSRIPGSQGTFIRAPLCARSVAANCAHGCICCCSSFLAEARRVRAHPLVALPYHRVSHLNPVLPYALGSNASGLAAVALPVPLAGPILLAVPSARVGAAPMAGNLPTPSFNTHGAAVLYGCCKSLTARVQHPYLSSFSCTRPTSWPCRHRCIGAKARPCQISDVTMAYALTSEMSHATPGSPIYAEGEPANLIDASSPVQL